MNEIIVNYDNITLVLIGIYQKGDDRTYMYPGSDSDFNLCEVLCGGQDIIDMLMTDTIMDLEILAVEQIEQL